MTEVKRVPWVPGKAYPVLALSRWTKGALSGAFHDSASSSSLSNEPGYVEAKRNGDIRAARAIVERFLTMDRLKNVRDLVGNQDPLVVAPCIRAKGQHNVLPVSLAHHVAYQLNLKVNKDVFQKSGPRRTGQDGIGRLFNQPSFHGKVERGRSYLLVDDVLVLGGTLAGLRSHIEANGGNVLGMVALARTHKRAEDESFGVRTLRSGTDVLDLAIRPFDVACLARRFGKTLNKICKEAFGFDETCLTVREGAFLGNLQSLDLLERSPG